MEDVGAVEPVGGQPVNGSAASTVKGAASHDSQESTWSKEKKHFFILSSAGKPVYARYGEEADVSSYLGVAQAIISSFESSGDQIRCLNAGRHRFVFLNRNPLYLVVVSHTGESEAQLRSQLSLLYNQLLSIMTAPQITRLYSKRINFDLRRFLAGTDNLFDSLVDSLSSCSSMELKSIRCARLEAPVRSAITQALKSCRIKDIRYAAVFVNGRIASYSQPRSHPLHPFDLQILSNMVHTSTKYGAGETWTPLCLPRWNHTAFVNVYVNHLSPNVCVVALARDKDAFFALSAYQTKLTQVKSALRAYCYACLTSAVVASVADIGIPGLRHCMFRSTQSKQIAIAEPITYNEGDQQRLFGLYQHASGLLHARSAPIMVHYHTTATETLMAWSSASFELYAVFGPFISKSSVITAVNTLIRWIQKAEDALFVSRPLLF
ncbi:MON1-like protein A-like protein [Thamnocephalis sphaerospora]|uniref:Vacuolar fusion protein MON1 n=1 Tax=Thamnocephalis sphaerospora TaxID=78915 RepID=A0A4P9XJQ2_9FUNG|nr:MON1-like protein A-like protein [Thamnocephalis sphaerospora]|eukprot:RKP05985.1 MON1-like protein A-like protein [Thamnocephalis sphaerospora]